MQEDGIKAQEIANKNAVGWCWAGFSCQGENQRQM